MASVAYITFNGINLLNSIAEVISKKILPFIW